MYIWLCTACDEEFWTSSEYKPPGPSCPNCESSKVEKIANETTAHQSGAAIVRQGWDGESKEVCKAGIELAKACLDNLNDICVCSAGYKDRGLRDPQCEYCTTSKWILPIAKKLLSLADV